MPTLLKQSTAVTVRIGPFLDKSDGVTEETGLAASLAFEVSKNNGAFAARNSATAPVHDSDGWYSCELDTTDTGTLGTLIVKSHDAATYLPVWEKFVVMPANVYDSLVAGSDTFEVDMIRINGGLTSGNNATLSLAGISVVNSAGDAIVVGSSGGNGRAVYGYGNGTGPAIDLVAGATASAARIRGGATGGIGLDVAGGAGGGDAIKAYAGAGGGSALNVKGYGASAAVNVTQTGTGEGVHFEGGNTSGPALAILSNDDNAVEIVSFGLNHDGVLIEVDGSGDALKLIGGPTSGVGLSISATGGNSDAVEIFGQGAGNGVRCEAGATGIGAYVRGGATSGNALVVEAQAGNSSGAVLLGQGTGNGLQAGSAGTGNGFRGIGGTGGSGAYFNAPTGGDGMTLEGSGLGFVDLRGDITGNLTGNVTGSVASITGDLGGSVIGDVAGKVLGGGASALVGTGVRAVDGAGNAIAPAATALSTATWTAPRAAALDLLDVATSTLATPADLLVTETNIRGADGDTLKTLSDQLDLVYSPSGLFQVTVVVSDQFAATVENMQVAIYDNANLVLLRRGVTDSVGSYTVAIDPGNYKVRLSAHWYDATVPENLVVAGDMTQAYAVTAWVPSPPAAAQLCVVYGTIIDASGTAVPNAAVRFKTLLPAIFDNITQSAGTIVEATTDAAGYFEAQLVRNAVVSVKVPTCGIDATRTVPDAVSQEFTAWADDE